MVKEYRETHQHGYITLENMEQFGKLTVLQADLGVQIARDGRVWICINGIAFLRFTPHINRKMFPDEKKKQ